jgi:hypothetical protein
MQKYQDLIGNQASFSSTLEKLIGEKTNYNADLIKQQQALQEQNYSLPAQLRAQYASSPIRNPLEMENLIAQRRANVGQQLGTTTGLLNARGQGLSSLLNQGLQAYQGNVSAAQAAAESALQQEQLAMQREAQKASERASKQQAALMSQYYNQGQPAPRTGMDIANTVMGDLSNAVKQAGTAVSYGDTLKSQKKSGAAKTLAGMTAGNLMAPGIGMAIYPASQAITKGILSTKWGQNLGNKLASSKAGQWLTSKLYR